MSGRLTIRNVKTEIIDALKERATLNERSTEAEARYALAMWTGISAYPDSTTRHNINPRLTLLKKMNPILAEEIMSSQGAEALGCPKGSTVANWFAGKEEPTFKQLDQLAAYFSVDPNWLKHGDESHITNISNT